MLQFFEFAKKNGCAVVTFDSDFVDLNVIKGFPPKIIWLKTGKMTTKAVSDLIRKNLVVIKNFLKSEENEILEVIY